MNPYQSPNVVDVKRKSINLRFVLTIVSYVLLGSAWLECMVLLLVSLYSWNMPLMDYIYVGSIVSAGVGIICGVNASFLEARERENEQNQP